jgi:predicted NBD/HSP70 family sugar kinase
MTFTGGARGASPCLVIDIGATKVEAALVAHVGEPSARAPLDGATHHGGLFHAMVDRRGSA